MRKGNSCKPLWNSKVPGIVVNVLWLMPQRMSCVSLLDINEGIDDLVHHYDFVLLSPQLKVLPTKFLQYCSGTAGSAVVTVAKPVRSR